LLLVVTFETMKKREEDMVRSVGGCGGTMDGSKLRRRERADGCMRGRTWKKYRERGKKIWRVLEAVNDAVIGGGDRCRAHVVVVGVMMLWEKKVWVVMWIRVR